MLWFLVKQSMKERERVWECECSGCVQAKRKMCGVRSSVASLRESRALGYKKSRDDRDVVVRDNNMAPPNFREIITQDTLEFGFGIHDKS